ncbi:MAG TPA: hypothetical protein VNH46_10535 [Gemmatimonadales bacterium]|nr:hypothetical protein [Gemmatimonadales bacterium]
MGTFLKNLRRNEASAEELAELRSLANRLESQRAKMEELVQHADRSIGQLQRLGTMGERVNVLESRVASLEQLTARIEAAEGRVADLVGTHEKLERDLDQADAGVEQVRGEVTGLTSAVAAASRIKDELAEILKLEGPVRELQARHSGLQEQFDQARGDLSRLREQHETVQAQYRAAGQRIQGFDTEWQRVSRSVAETETRLAGMEQLLADLTPVGETVVQTRRQITTVKAMADQLSQKVALLDQQGEVIDRATSKLEHLTGLMQRSDAGLERLAETSRTVTELRAQLEGVREAQGSLLDRTRSLAERLEQVDQGQGAMQRGLDALQHGLDRSTERLALEDRGLEGLGGRVTDLRQTLTEWEHRLAGLAESATTITTTSARAESLSGQVGAIAGELGKLSDLAVRVRSGWTDLERMETEVEGLNQRLCRVEEARPALDSALRDLASLSANHEAVRNALEQMRQAREDITGLRTNLGTTEAWLTETQRSIASLKEDVSGLDRMRATVDGLRQEVDQVTGAIDVVESRRAQVEDVQQKLTEASSLGASLEERARGLHQRLEAAEDHLGRLTPRLDEVSRAGSQLVALGAEVRDMEERVRTVQGSVTGVEQRTEQFAALAARMTDLTREIDQRQTALQRASEHLDRAVTLRQEAAEAAEKLNDRVRDLDGGLDRAGERLDTVEGLSRELDTRLSSLTAVHDRMTAFEEKLAAWRGAEQQLSQAMEQAAARQSTIASLESEVRGLYSLAERTMSDVRQIAEAQPQVARARGELEEVMHRLGEVDQAVHHLDDRRRQLGRAEERLAHAETLLLDVRGGLELLLTQKAQVDHLLEKAGALQLEARQAEVLISTLREERRVTERVRAGLAELRRQDEAADEEDGDRERESES